MLRNSRKPPQSFHEVEIKQSSQIFDLPGKLPYTKSDQPHLSMLQLILLLLTARNAKEIQQM